GDFIIRFRYSFIINGVQRSQYICPSFLGIDGHECRFSRVRIAAFDLQPRFWPARHVRKRTRHHYGTAPAPPHERADCTEATITQMAEAGIVGPDLDETYWSQGRPKRQGYKIRDLYT